jgi:hypothetical protein
MMVISGFGRKLPQKPVSEGEKSGHGVLGLLFDCCKIVFANISRGEKPVHPINGSDRLDLSRTR